MKRKNYLASVVALAAAVLGAWAEAPRSEAAGGVEGTRAAVAKWLGTQQLLLKERKDWQQGREILSSRLELVNKEITQLEEKLAEASARAAETRGKGANLALEGRALVDAAAALEAAVRGLEIDVSRLYLVLPTSVKEKLAPLQQRIPQGSAAAQVSLAERFQNVLGILNEVNKVNGEITVAREVRAMADGKPSEVKTVYVGLAQAYFLSARGEAGVGRPGAGGWTWQPANELAGSIAEVLDVLESKSSPRFIALPVQIQ